MDSSLLLLATFALTGFTSLIPPPSEAPPVPAPLTLFAVAADENDYYTVDHLVPPQGAICEIGGMGFLSDGRLVLSTRRGQVWIVDNPLAKNASDAEFHLFCEGLQEGLGLAIVNDEVYVLQRTELSRLLDLDHDGTCDSIDTVSNGWGVSGNYHEFAFGLPVDAQGNFYLSLNLGFTDPKWWHGRSLAPWRGWVLQIDPKGNVTPFANGFRSPCGLGLNAAGDLFATDNQGDWMPVCPIEHVKRGAFYGQPASLVWTDAYQSTKTEPSVTNPVANERTAPACWIPYKWSRSTGDMVPAPKDGSFGPFREDQLILAELTNGLVFRADLEKVRGEYQGAVMLMRQKVGSAVRALFGADGTLFCGLTNRGWGGLAPGHGVARVRWTGRTPMEIAHVKLVQDGFVITFTLPLPEPWAARPGTVALESYHYDWWWEYGSPERDTRALPVDGMGVSADRLRLLVKSSGIEAGKVVRCVLNNIVSQSGEPLLHPEFAYTINQLPEGPLCTTPVARVAPPPPARESGAEGWLRLCFGDAFDRWNTQGWKLVDAELDAADETKLALRDGNGALVNETGADGKPAVFTSKNQFGDGRYGFEFMLPKGGELSVLLQGCYEVRFADPGPERALDVQSCGAILPTASWPGKAPLLSVFHGPGQWHSVEITFRAPRFDASGKKIANARLVRALVDDVLFQDEVELPEPSPRAVAAESALGPYVFLGSTKTAALRGIEIRPAPPKLDLAKATALVKDDELSGWRATAGGAWKCEEGQVTSGGAKSFLVTDTTDWKDFRLTFRAKISGGGLSGVWLRAQPNADGSMRGWRACINADYPEPEYTGSIAGLAPIKAQLVGPETWFDGRIDVRTEKDGVRVTYAVNGIVVSSIVDAASKWDAGAIALEQHHEGSVAVFKDLWIERL